MLLSELAGCRKYSPWMLLLGHETTPHVIMALWGQFKQGGWSSWWRMLPSHAHGKSNCVGTETGKVADRVNPVSPRSGITSGKLLQGREVKIIKLGRYHDKGFYTCSENV